MAERNAEKRREEILNAIRANGKVRVTELSVKYGISEVSIRKDLEILEERGQLARVHGGAVGFEKMYVNMDLEERARTNAEAKRRLADAVARLVEDNDTLMMNAGTTLSYVLRAIKGKHNISVVTNSIPNANEAALYSSFHVILLGGELDPKYQFTYGKNAEEQLRQYHATKCILSVDGVRADAGLTLYYANEAALAKRMMESSDNVIIAADASKIGKSAFAQIENVSAGQILVTTESADRAELERLRQAGVTTLEA